MLHLADYKDNRISVASGRLNSGYIKALD
jgi:hypothetical protein